jgi:multidrug efflux pump subunit AcrB
VAKVANNRSQNTGRVRDGGLIRSIWWWARNAESRRLPLLLTTRDAAIYVADVAQVKFVSADNADVIVANVTHTENGGTARAPAVTLAVAKRAGANAVVNDFVLQRVRNAQSSLIRKRSMSS